MEPQNEQTRVVTSLDGEWTFLTDPDDDGKQRALHDPGTVWPDDVEAVTVPHAWQEADEHREYVGTAWYKTSITYEGHGDREFLRFGAVDYEATVYVNGQRVGANSDGYLPFEIEVTEAITTGENVVVVAVTDPADLDEIPHGKQGEPWYTRVSGIWQSVSLESRPERFVADLKATPNLDDDTVAVDVEVDGATSDLNVTVTVERDDDAVARETIDHVDGGERRISIPDPDYWTPDRPALYDVAVELRADGQLVDAYEDYFGMRSVSVDSDRLYLNGEPIYVRGALDQAFYPDTLYRPFEDELFEYEIRTAKELGFNLLRKHIKPAHPDFIEAADRLGILVWEEPANPDLYTARSKQAVRDQIRGMIDRDYNSPSVVIWSLYNEEWGIGLDQEDFSDHEGRLWNDEAKQEYLTKLFNECKGWDPTRPVCDNSGWAHVATDLNDYHRYFVSPDRAEAWADDLDDIVANPGDNYAVENTPAADAPILVSEFGTWGFPDLPKLRDHYGGDPPWFSHDFLDSPLKRPKGVDERYEATNLPEVFDGYEALAEAWQRRESRSLQGIVQAMRTNDAVAGYVVTEFSDIEWEFNGVLDYLRDPKSFVDEFARVNDDLLVAIEPSTHAVAPGETVEIDVRIVNDTNVPLEGRLRWTALDDEGERSVSVDPFGTTTVADGIPISAPGDAAPGPRDVEATFETDDRTVAGEEPLVVVHPEDAGGATVYAEPPLNRRLDEAGIAVTDDLGAADVAVVESMDEAVSAFVERGNAALLVPGADGRMSSNDVFEYRNLPAGESWNLVASLLYHDGDLVGDLCLDAPVGWAFEGLFPHDLAVGLDRETDEVHVGSVEGWVANWGSPLVVREYGRGRVCSCSFRVTGTYGEHPTATALVNRVIRAL